ncbi:hypothetical protein BDR07DRAFT_968733 [Suillus spraguei]|nr:hypothetical protein BDR07DRAFT_968733 [Suillus spraguei]
MEYAQRGSVTLGLHCAELVADVVRDETIWRRGKQGSNSSVNSSFSSWFYALFLCNWLHIVLFCAKPFLHWLFGLAVEIYVASTSPGVISFSDILFSVQSLRRRHYLHISGLPPSKRS